MLESLVFSGAPEHICAVLEALQFNNGSVARLQNLPEREWPRLLEWCDARQLSLLLDSICGEDMPDRMRREIVRRRTRYSMRFERLKRELFEIAARLNQAGLEFAVLKGLTHSPALTPDPLARAQGDIDLWLKPGSVSTAKQILVGLGYIPLSSAKSRHLDPMARPTNWRWQDDRFDPEMPISVELHYELWSRDAERITVPDQDGFWRRKITRCFEGHQLNVLCNEDLLGFAALHLLLHVLHGELPLQRAWEIANFLHTRATDEAFWSSWREAHPAELRHLESLTFSLVRNWFGCTWPVALDSEMESLTRAVRVWLERFSWSPLKREWQPNKDEIWLHMALIPAFRAKIEVLFRRLFPINGASSNASRLAHHARTLFPTVFTGLRWLTFRPAASEITSITRSR